MEIIATKKRTMELLMERGLNPKKSFGQNFLIEPSIIDKIVEGSKISSAMDVIEIGAGLGGLTQGLLGKAHHVFAYEIDNDLIPILQNNFYEFSNFTLFHQDFMKCDLKNIESVLPKVVVANLPYYITNDILLRFITQEIQVDKVVAMMQKEVALKIIKNKGGKDENLLTFLCQIYCDVKLVTHVSKNAFIPRPAIDSTVLSFTMVKKYPSIENDRKFIEVAKALLFMRRKTVLNNLSSYLQNKERATEVLQRAKISLLARSDDLSIGDYINIANFI